MCFNPYCSKKEVSFKTERGLNRHFLNNNSCLLYMMNQRNNKEDDNNNIKFYLDMNSNKKRCLEKNINYSDNANSKYNIMNFALDDMQFH